MLSLTSSLISPAGAPPVISTSWTLSKDTQTALGTGYKSFTIQITWDPSIAKLDPSSIQSISKTSNGDIFQYDAKSIDGGVLRIVGFSSTLQNFANSLTLPVVNFNYTQTTLAPVKFYVNVEQFNGISYKNLAIGDPYSVNLGTSTAAQILPAIASTVPTLGGVMAVLAPTVGPLIGGWITQTFSWHWLFLINVLPGAVAATVAGLLLPKDPMAPGDARTLDLAALAMIATALAALEIALKEAPARGWIAGPVVGLLVLSAVGLAGFIARTHKARHPIVDLGSLGYRNFVVGCVLSFVLGVGLFGSVYLMPVFLAFVRHHNALEIGTIMLVTGTAQLVTAPVAVVLERRLGAGLLSAVGFALFGLGLWLSSAETPQTDFDAMFWPQVIRGLAIMFCLLPPTRLALGSLPPGMVADASGLFNLMRNLGGAIGIALIDTVIYGRSTMHGDLMARRLLAGDIETARFIGIPLERFIAADPLDPATQALVQPLVEAAALTLAINDAWGLIAALTFGALMCLPFIQRPPPPPIGAASA